MSQVSRFGVLAVLGLVLVGAPACMSTSLPPVRVLGTRTDETHKATYNGLALRSGQLVVTESPDTTSFMFPLLAKRFYPFTHIAVISIEGGEPWVYDLTGSVDTFPTKKKLLANVSGKVYRRKLFEYVAPNLYAEIYDLPPGTDGEKVAAYARKTFKDGVEFDPFFDVFDHSTMYCSEMVALAIEAGGGPKYEPEAANPNPSVREGLKWLSVPAAGLPVGRFVEPSRYVGALGQFPTRTAAWSYFEAKRELHRRFTMDQRLGYILSIDNYGRIDVRPEISSFVAEAAHLFDNDPNPPEPGDPRIEAGVRKLAAARFGPFPDAPSPPASTP